jgi:hypothetical protein
MRQGQMAEIPWFQIRKVERSPARLIGSLSSTRYGSTRWVKAGWLGDLRVGNRFVGGRWSRAWFSWAFTLTDDAALEVIGSSKRLQAFDGYWAERAALVLDESLTWARATWEDPADHDHCSICWARIYTDENTIHYLAKRNVRVCSECYSCYVQPRSIDFRELGGPAA